MFNYKPVNIIKQKKTEYVIKLKWIIQHWFIIIENKNKPDNKLPFWKL